MWPEILPELLPVVSSDSNNWWNGRRTVRDVAGGIAGIVADFLPESLLYMLSSGMNLCQG
ncbi:MAG: hypothetical protein ACXVDI_14770 [Ktedonobacterales bacterium]